MPNSLEVCDSCGCKVRLSRLEEHKQKCPGGISTRCDVCGRKVRLDQLEEHKQQAHRNRDYTSCDICGGKVRQDRLEEHKEKCLKRESVVSDSSKLVPCPYCSQQVRASRLPRHIKRVHRGKLKKRSFPRKYGGAFCQICGTHLTSTCFSTTQTSGAVPRTNKICPGCFHNLSEYEKPLFYRYKYVKSGLRTVNSGQMRKR